MRQVFRIQDGSCQASSSDVGSAIVPHGLEEAEHADPFERALPKKKRRPVKDSWFILVVRYSFTPGVLRVSVQFRAVTCNAFPRFLRPYLRVSVCLFLARQCLLRSAYLDFHAISFFFYTTENSNYRVFVLPRIRDTGCSNYLCLLFRVRLPPLSESRVSAFRVLVRSISIWNVIHWHGMSLFVHLLIFSWGWFSFHCRRYSHFRKVVE